MLRTLMAAIFGILLGLGIAQGEAQAAETHNVVVHVDENDAQKMNIVLNNVTNAVSTFMEAGEEITVEIVVHGPGLNMVIPGKSPVADRVKSVKQNFSNVSIKACANTMKMMERKTGKKVELMPEADVIPAGVVHLIRRQEEGWVYLRP